MGTLFNFLLIIAVLSAYGEKCEEIQSCTLCLKKFTCSFYMLSEGGVCGNINMPAYKFISQVRSFESCGKVDSIIKAQLAMERGIEKTNGSQPVTLKLVSNLTGTLTTNSERMDGEPKTNTSRTSASIFAVDTAFMRKGFSELKLDFLTTNCRLYVLIFRKIHPKSNRVQQEYLRCLKKM